MMRRKTPGLTALGLIALFAAALCVRLIHLGKADLWQDEILLVQTASPDMTPGEVWKAYNSIAVSMAWLPMPAVLQNVYLRTVESFTGERVRDPFAQRAPGVLLGALAVPVMAGIGFMLGDRRLGWLAGLWCLFHFYFIFYSREIHAYPMLMLLSALHWLFMVRMWRGPVDHKRWYIACAILQVGLGLSHLTAAMMMGASGIVTLALFVKALHEKAHTMRRHLLLTGIVQASGIVGVLPYYVAILTKGNPHLDMGTSISFGGMLYDFAAKVMFGELYVPALIGLAILLLGIIFLIGFVPQRQSARLVLIASAMTYLFIALAAKQTQYVSARYFMALAPLMAVCAPAGLLMIAKGAKIITRAKVGEATLGFGLLVIALLPHLIVFLPHYYRLPAKSVDFGAIADWINQQLEPGAPYLMESAYELRFVGNFYPTTNNLGASPYVHGSAQGDIGRLHERQIAFMQQFPEAPFIESAHHNAGTPEGIWTWPHLNFRQHVRLPNDPLRHLIQLGIYPVEPGTELNETDFHVDIYFNKLEDRLAAARAKGESAIFFYPDWRVGGHQIAPNATDYFRVAPGVRSNVKVIRASDGPIRGDIIATIAVISGSPAETITLRFADNTPVSYRLAPGQFNQLLLNNVELTDEEGTLEIRHRPDFVTALLVRGITFNKNNY